MIASLLLTLTAVLFFTGAVLALQSGMTLDQFGARPYVGRLISASMIKELGPVLTALLEPIEQMKKVELSGDYTQRLALLEEIKGLPFGAVWDYHCLKHGVPVGLRFMDEVRAYEKQVLAKRNA